MKPVTLDTLLDKTISNHLKIGKAQGKGIFLFNKIQ